MTLPRVGTGLPLWDRATYPDEAAMSRRTDPQTSKDAATKVRRKLSRLHGKVLRALLRHGPMTDAELERLDVFASLGPSTVRKRRGELVAAGHVVEAGGRKNERGQRMIVWALRPRTKWTWGRSDEATERRSDAGAE